MTEKHPAGDEPLPDIRAAIDGIDAEMIRLIATRQRWVAAAGREKARSAEGSAETVDAPARVQQVIDRVRERAAAEGASPDVVEATYRAMIAAFIEYEREVHDSAGQ